MPYAETYNQPTPSDATFTFFFKDALKRKCQEYNCRKQIRKLAHFFFAQKMCKFLWILPKFDNFCKLTCSECFFFLRKSFYLFFSPWLSFWTTILGFVLFFLPRNPFAKNCAHFAKNYTHFTKNYKHFAKNCKHFAKKTRKSVCAFTDIDSGNHNNQNVLGKLGFLLRFQYSKVLVFYQMNQKP